MFRQGCLVFTGRGSHCERERKLWCLFQTEEESAFFTQQFSIYIFSRWKRCTTGKRDSSRPGKQEGSDGSDPAAMRLDLTTSCPALSHNSLDHTFRKCMNHATQRKENFTSKYHLKLRFGKFWVGHDAGFSHLSHQSLYNFPYLLQLHQQKPCHLPIRLFLSQHPNAFLTLGYLRERAMPEPCEAIRSNLSGDAWWCAGTKLSHWSLVKWRRPFLVLASITCPGITTRSCYLPIITTPHTS